MKLLLGLLYVASLGLLGLRLALIFETHLALWALRDRWLQRLCTSQFYNKYTEPSSIHPGPGLVGELQRLEYPAFLRPVFMGAASRDVWGHGEPRLRTTRLAISPPRNAIT
ncbi:hypothetical protein C8R47DRAFT_1073721 [Mycena vitilis]|nr:hypothetical protein C8R47DRAFT_1073721 [Mycena vitilis]